MSAPDAPSAADAAPLVQEHDEHLVKASEELCALLGRRGRTYGYRDDVLSLALVLAHLQGRFDPSMASMKLVVLRQMAQERDLPISMQKILQEAVRP